MYRPVEYRKDFKFSRIKRPNEREDEHKTKKKEEKKHDFFSENYNCDEYTKLIGIFIQRRQSYSIRVFIVVTCPFLHLKLSLSE